MHQFNLICADTDSFTVCKPDGSPFSKEETDRLTKELNSLYPSSINWEFEFNYPKMAVLKAKNYIMLDENGKVSLKGSSLKSSTIEPILKRMMSEIIDCILSEQINNIKNIRQKYIDMVDNIIDITPWCSKKTLSPTTYNSERKNETDIINALSNSEYKSGDRIYVFVDSKIVETGELYKTGSKKGQPKTKKINYLVLKENFKNNYCKEHYKSRVKKVAQIFESVLGKGFFDIDK